MSKIPKLPHDLVNYTKYPYESTKILQNTKLLFFLSHPKLIPIYIGHEQ
jgi:hypothetical protein